MLQVSHSLPPREIRPHGFHVHPCVRVIMHLPQLPTSNRLHLRKLASVLEATDGVKQATSGASVDPAYVNGAAFLRANGITNPAEVARVLDIAMNPNSLFILPNGRRSANATARTLDVEKDMKPVIDFLQSRGVTVADTVKIILGHPPVLGYSLERLQGFWDYLGSVGIKDVAAAVVSRPSLLGLDVDKNLRKIVEYLQYTETPPETIVQYLLESI